MGNIKSYDMKKIKVSNDNLDTFECMVSRRKIGSGNVSTIKKALVDDDMLTPFVVNRKNGFDVLVDGNHRYEALKQFFNQNPNEEVTIWLAIYENLTQDEEREVYKKWAKQKTQSISDMLEVYKPTIGFFNLIEREDFPANIKIHTNKSAMRFKTFLDAYYNIKKESMNHYRATKLNKNNCIAFAQNLLYDDYRKVQKFFIWFVDTFGLTNKDNMFIKPQYFGPLMHIYFTNTEKFTDVMLSKRMEKVIPFNDPVLKQALNTTGSEILENVRKQMIKLMNHNRSRKLVV